MMLNNVVNKRFFVLLSLLMVANGLLYAQSNRSLRQLREGNKTYKSKNYKQAEINYRKALEKDPGYLKATYNLGNALYRQGRFEEAAKCYQEVVDHPNVDKKVAASAWHNQGNILLNAQKYQESMEAFKNSLKLDPKSERARYNYEFARRKIQQQKNQQKNQQKEQSNQDKKPQEKKQDKKQDKQRQQKQQQRRQQDKKDMERQLNALNQNEKKTTEKLKKEKQAGAKTKLEKDW